MDRQTHLVCFLSQLFFGPIDFSPLCNSPQTERRRVDREMKGQLREREKKRGGEHVQTSTLINSYYVPPPADSE